MRYSSIQTLFLEHIWYDIQPDNKPGSWVINHYKKGASKKALKTPIYVFNENNPDGKIRHLRSIPRFGWKAIKFDRLQKVFIVDDTEPKLKTSKVILNKSQ